MITRETNNTENSVIGRLVAPKSVAVVGASPDIEKPGGRCLKFLRKNAYEGVILPINPKYKEIDGMVCYPDFASLPCVPDLVLFTVPASAVIEGLERAAKAGASSAIVFSSGFAESGAEGEALQKDLAAVARKHGMALLGPNCLGLVDLRSKVVASFSTALAEDIPFRAGPSALISQSGAMGMAVFVLAQREAVGLGALVSTGNEAVLDFTDMLNHYGDDPKTSLILGYAESIRDGREFVRAARRAHRRGKAVAVLKVGRSDAGERAARSHTGALSGSAQVYEAAFRRAGVMAADTLQDLLDIAVVSPGARRAAGRSVGIVSMSGGAGVMMADACSLLDLELASLSAETRERLGRLLPPFTPLENPVDVGGIYGNIDAVAQVIKDVALDLDVHQVLVFIGMSPSLLGRIESRLAALQKELGKPLIVAWLAGPMEGVRTLRSAGVPAFDDPTRAVKAAAFLADAGRPLPGPDVDVAAVGNAERAAKFAEKLAGLRREGYSALTERQVKEMLAGYGIPVIREIFARSSTEAAEAARELGGPLAIKAEAPELLHKSDAGAVQLGVEESGAAAAFDRVVNAASAVVGREGVLGAVLQPMAKPGLEILLGLRFDPQFGPTITVGMGGVQSEVLADATTELVPVDEATALSMLSRLRSARLFGAFRGAPAPDIKSLTSAIVGLSELAMDAGSMISELDINPVIVHREGLGCTVVDGVAILSVLEEANP